MAKDPTMEAGWIVMKLTGLPGTGKSTIASILKREGFEVQRSTVENQERMTEVWLVKMKGVP